MIEVLISLFILVLIGGAAYAIQTNIFSLNNFISSSLLIQDEARKALKTMSSEIRTISPASTGSYPIDQATDFSFVFYSNIDQDSLKERVRYFLDGTDLKKGVIKPSGSPLSYNSGNETITYLARDIRNGPTPIFSYYDTAYDGTTQSLGNPVNVPAVRLVKIMLIIDKDPNKSPAPLNFITEISMRNLKDNL